MIGWKNQKIKKTKRNSDKNSVYYSDNEVSIPLTTELNISSSKKIQNYSELQADNISIEKNKLGSLYKKRKELIIKQNGIEYYKSDYSEENSEDFEKKNDIKIKSPKNKKNSFGNRMVGLSRDIARRKEYTYNSPKKIYSVTETTQEERENNKKNNLESENKTIRMLNRESHRIKKSAIFFWCQNYRQTIFLLVSSVIFIRSAVVIFLINLFYKEYFISPVFHTLNLLLSIYMLLTLLGLTNFFYFKSCKTSLHRLIFVYDFIVIFLFIFLVNYRFIIEFVGLFMLQSVRKRASKMAEIVSLLFALVLPLEIVNLIILYHHKKAVKFPLIL